MFDADKWQEIWHTIRQNKLRTLLTAAGVFWGAFMLIVMLGAGTGLENGVKGNMAGFATNSIFVWAERTSVPYAGLQPGRDVRFNTSDVEAIRQRVDEIEYLAPRNQLGGFRGGASVTRGTETGAFSVLGDYPDIQHIMSMTFVQGRFINSIDMQQRRKVAVIGDAVREVLFGPDEQVLGQEIKINGIFFQVVGEIKPIQTGENGERLSNTVFVPFATFQQTFNFGDDVGWFSITAKPHASSARMEKHVREILAARHKISPDDQQAIGGFNVEERFQRVVGLFQGIKFLIWVVGVFTLAAGALGVSNIMLIVVRERTKEIGVRKAVGAKPSSIIALILQEAVVLTSLAGYLGFVLGVLVVEAVDTAVTKYGVGGGMFARPGVDFDVALIATLLLIVSGVLAGIMPALNAVRVNPVEALRAE